jgi:hypothetical protein
MITKQLSEGLVPENLESVFSNGASAVSVAARANSRFVVHGVQVSYTGNGTNSATLEIDDEDFNHVFFIKLPDTAELQVFQFPVTVAIPWGKGLVVSGGNMTSPDINVQYSIESK